MNEHDRANLEAVAEGFGIKGRPECESCGDPVKLIFHNGTPVFAQHCRECFAELKYGKIPKLKRKRTL